MLSAATRGPLLLPMQLNTPGRRALSGARRAPFSCKRKRGGLDPDDEIPPHGGAVGLLVRGQLPRVAKQATGPAMPGPWRFWLATPGRLMRLWIAPTSGWP